MIECRVLAAPVWVYSMIKVPLIAEYDGSVVVFVSYDPAHCLVDGSRGLLPIPLLPSQHLHTHTHTHQTNITSSIAVHHYFNSLCSSL